MSKNDNEYRYFMDDNKLMRFHVEQEEYWENPRDEFDYFTKMYMSSREYTCTDDKISDVKSNEDAIRMMISDAEIDITEAVKDGRIPRMEIKYDDEYECYELWVDGYCEADNECYEWLEDDIIEYLNADDLKKVSDDLYVIALDFGYQGSINEHYSDRCEPDGYIWTSKNDMIEAGFKDMTTDELYNRAYELLNAEIEEENLWAIGDVFWFEIEECTNVTDCDNEANWEDYDSCGGFIVDGYKAYDEIYDEAVGSGTPYHEDLDTLYDWQEFRISFEDYFEILSGAETSEEIDSFRESLKGKIDWTVKSIAEYENEISDKISELKSRMDYIISVFNNTLNRSENEYPFFDGASADYHKSYEDYIDMNYRLKELKAIA